MICEDAMHLNNVLVSYRDDHNVYYNLEQSIFKIDFSDNGKITEVIGNDSIYLNGRPLVSLYGASRIDGLLLRGKLNQSIIIMTCAALV